MRRKPSLHGTPSSVIWRRSARAWCRQDGSRRRRIPPKENNTMQIDLNADLGEGWENDEALLGLVSSANIACGWHAGDARTMRQCVRWAIDNGVAIGAHPSFP